MSPFTVMLVEDEKIMREDLLSIIDWEAEGFKILGVAVTGKQGLDLFEKLRPQIVISDIRMPVIDGLTMAKTIKAISPHTHILILSAFGEFEYAKEAIRAGADDYILKTELSPSLMSQKLATLREKLEKNRHMERAKDRLRELIDSPETTEDISSELADIEKILEGSPPDKNYSSLVLKAMKYMNQNYGSNALRTEDVAQHVHLSKSRMGVLFKQETGQTLNDYLTRVRIEAAKALLLSGKYKVYEVAEMVGYQTSQYFSQIFYQSTGQYPNKYRREV